MKDLAVLGTIKPKITRSKMGFAPNGNVNNGYFDLEIKDTSFGIRQLDIYRQYWDGMYQFRKQRERASRYFRGEQWHEWVTNAMGYKIREYEKIQESGQIPFIQNIIKPTIRTLEGQFRNDTSRSVVVSRTPEKQKESEMLSNALQCSLVSINNAKELDARALEEYLISGLAIQRIDWERFTSLKRKDAKISNVHTNIAFFNGDILDIRGMDIRVIGQLHDWTLNDLITNFAHDENGNYVASKEVALREIYSANISDYINRLGLDPENHYSYDFYTPQDPSKCRVIEVWEERIVPVMMVHDLMTGKKYETDWKKSDIDKLNQFRIQKYVAAGVAKEDVPLMEGHIEHVKRWYYMFFTPYGHVLREGETPFWHGTHPFIVLPYPLLDGHITGLVSDLIDPQRQFNRLLILRDMILHSSVKNPVFIDKESADGQSEEEIADKLKTPGSVVLLDYKAGKTQQPYEMRGANNNMGIPEMLSTYSKLMQDISGVNPAMQGQTAPSGTSGTLYAQQALNSTMNSKDIMEAFANLFRRERDMKLLKTIQQYYDSPRMLAIAGKSYSETAQLYDPEKVQEIDFDLTIGQTSDSPVYRDVINNRLFDLLTGNFIDIETYFENTTDPYSSNILESLRKRKEQLQQNPVEALNGFTGDVNTIGQQVPMAS